jgi:tetratricopeptide (TPR) repeat protein
MNYSIPEHPAVQDAKANRDQAEEAMHEARQAAEAAIERARSLKAEATAAAKDGRDADAEDLLDEALEMKQTAEKKAAIADAREEMAEEAEHAFRGAINAAKQELKEQAREERGEKLRAALGAYDQFAEKLKAARAIDETYAALAGSQAAKAIPPLQVGGAHGTTTTLNKFMDKVREQAEEDLARAA